MNSWGANDEPGNMLFRIDFEIGIYPDRIQVSDRRSGRFVDFTAEVPFSAPTRLVADPVYFENALAKAMRKAMSGGFILLDAQADVVVGRQVLDFAERQTIRRVLRDIGFKTVRFDGNDIDTRPPSYRTALRRCSKHLHRRPVAIPSGTTRESDRCARRVTLRAGPRTP